MACGSVVAAAESGSLHANLSGYADLCMHIPITDASLPMQVCCSCINLNMYYFEAGQTSHYASIVCLKTHKGL